MYVLETIWFLDSLNSFLYLNSVELANMMHILYHQLLHAPEPPDSFVYQTQVLLLGSYGLGEMDQSNGICKEKKMNKLELRKHCW